MFRVLTCLSVEHDWRLVGLAGMVCFVASIAAVTLLHRAQATRGGLRAAWLLTAGTVTGWGIWSTHFIAMLAYDPGVSLGYDVGLTSVSLVAAVGLTSIGLWVAMLRRRWAPAAGGVIVGGGVAAMHYLGMSALEMPGHISWAKDLVIASILIGMLLGMAALVTAVRQDGPWPSLVSTILLTLAIISHHFTAMGAVAVIADPSQVVQESSLSPTALALAIAGIAVALLGISIIAALADSRFAVMRVRQQVTEVTETRVREQNLRLEAAKLQLDAAVNNMPQGLCMFDADQRLLVCNTRYAEMYGLEPEHTTPGTTLRTILERRVATGNSPQDTEAYIEDRIREVTGRKAYIKENVLRDGRTISVIHQPMSNGGWVAIHQDVTERDRVQAELKSQHEIVKQHEEQLRVRNTQFDLAINNMSQGLCFFDGAQRLVVCNRRYIEMYRLNPDLVHPGTTLREIIDLRFAAGSFPQMGPEEYYTWRNQVAVSAEPTDSVVELKNGKTFEIRHRPMPDGGWVATHEDITEGEYTKRALAQESQRFAAALNNMPHGLCMLDLEDRLIVCNRQYAEMYSLPPELTQQGTPIAKIIEHRIQTGQGPLDVDTYQSQRQARIAAEERTRYKLPLADGRTLQIDYEPMQGGYVTTHQDITEATKAEARIAHMARHDALTDLPNRLFFRERVEYALADMRRSEHLAVLCLDLDRFKIVNDTLGHPMGDRLLVAVGHRLRESLRESDIVARLGGDEFAIVQIGATEQPAEAAGLAGRLVDVISAPYELEGQQVVVNVSIGVAVAPTDGHDADQLLKNADMALYRAKADGRGTYRFFEREMDALTQARRALELDLRAALKIGEFELYYQPIVALSTGQITTFEALVRWHHPSRGLISPADFIPLAEETGLIVPLGEWVLRQACIEATRWPNQIHVAVNLSPVQFKNRTLAQTVFSALAASRLAPGRLELEITESVLLQDNVVTTETLHTLRNFGVGISMDDFGTGYSSLSYIRSFPFDKIKIDRSFINELSTREDCMAIVRAVTGLGASLKMSTTAEGVETMEQLEALRDAGCTEIQGYLVSRPVPASQLGELLQGVGITKLAVA